LIEVGVVGNAHNSEAGVLSTAHLTKDPTMRAMISPRTTVSAGDRPVLPSETGELVEDLFV
jgi:hypothetical protein